MKILITAFDPFGGETTNAAMQALELVETEACEIIKLIVPTSFERSVDAVCKAICEHKPSAVIMLGQAAERAAVTVERVAINVDDASIADNDDYKPKDKYIVENGSAAYFSTLPIKEIVSDMKQRGIPAQISNTAGTFVCNHLMYGVLHFLSIMFPKTPAGFIHLPITPSQAARSGRAIASMPPEISAKAVKSAVETTAKYIEYGNITQNEEV